MQRPKLDVLVAMFAYGGNGGVSTVLPNHATWLASTALKMRSDDRIGQIMIKTYSDTPLPMQRNRVVVEAKEANVDIILMLDSDNVPDLYAGKCPRSKEFWDSSFDFVYERKLRGLPSVVCAPYCGPPPHPVSGGEENVYVFYPTACEGGTNHTAIRFDAYSREHAAQMRGIQPIAAGPTGVIMYTTDAFDLMNVRSLSIEQILDMYKNGEITASRGKQLIEMESWFYYEYTDPYCTRKASTEDVTNTREIQMAGIQKFKEPVVFCNWDSWAGHYKPKCVGRPEPIRVESVSSMFAEAIRNNISAGDEVLQLDLYDEDIDGKVNEVLTKTNKQDASHAMNIDGVRVDAVVRPGLANDLQEAKDLAQMLINEFGSIRVLEISDDDGAIAIGVSNIPGSTVFAIRHEDNAKAAANFNRSNARLVQSKKPATEWLANLAPQEVNLLMVHDTSEPYEQLVPLCVKQLCSGGVLVFPRGFGETLWAGPEFDDWTDIEFNGFDAIRKP